MKRNQKGFTLIELLVVIAIIGILAGVVLTSLNTARAKARDAQDISNIKSVQLALELYADDNNGSYPTATTVCDGTTTFYGLEELVSGYIPQIPVDADENCLVQYSTDGPSATDYHIGIVLEDANNSVLNTDNDTDSTGWTVGSKFDGESAGCTLTSGTDQCYDIASK